MLTLIKICCALTTVKCHCHNKENGKPWYYQPEIAWWIIGNLIYVKCLFFLLLFHICCRMEGRRKTQSKAKTPNYWQENEAIWVFSSCFYLGQKKTFLSASKGYSSLCWRNSRLTIHTINLIKHTQCMSVSV